MNARLPNWPCDRLRFWSQSCAATFRRAAVQARRRVRSERRKIQSARRLTDNNAPAQAVRDLHRGTSSLCSFAFFQTEESEHLVHALDDAPHAASSTLVGSHETRQLLSSLLAFTAQSRGERIVGILRPRKPDRSRCKFALRSLRHKQVLRNSKAGHMIVMLVGDSENIHEAVGDLGNALYDIAHNVGIGRTYDNAAIDHDVKRRSISLR